MSAKAIGSLDEVVVLAGDRSTKLTTAFPELMSSCSKARLTWLTASDLAQLLGTDGGTVNWLNAIAWLQQRQFDGAFVITAAGQSPYTLAYLCYLAGIPVRIGRSAEFGGQVLTHRLPPIELPTAADP